MKNDELIGAKHQSGLVTIHWRRWNGVDRSEDYYLEGLNSNRARILAETLLKAADEADKFVKRKYSEELIELERQYEIIGNKIEELENKLAGQ